VLKIAKEPISLETPIGEEEDSHLGDFIEDKNTASPVDSVINIDLAEQVDKVLEASRRARRGSPDAVRDRREIRSHPRGGGPGLRGDPGADSPDRGEGAPETAPPQSEQAAADLHGVVMGRTALTPRKRAEDNEKMIMYPSGWAHSSVGQSHRLITGRSLVRGQVGPPISTLPWGLA